MGQGCSRRNRVQVSYQKLKTIKSSKTFFLDKDWKIILTPTQKFKAVVRRVIALLNIRKRTAYYFQHLKQLTDLANNGYPCSQALFKEFERKKGILNRTDFFAWDARRGIWERTRPPTNPTPTTTTRPTTTATRPYGRKLTQASNQPANTSAPRNPNIKN